MSEQTIGDGRTVLLKQVKLSFTDALYEKARTSEESDKLSHHCNVINPADGKFYKQNHEAMMAALRAAGEAQWKNSEAFKEIAEDSPKRVCYRKGEKWKNREGQVYEGYAGNWALSAKGPKAGQYRPELIDRAKRVLIDQANDEMRQTGRTFAASEIPSIFYGGVVADVWVSVYGTDKGSRGIFASIERIRSHQVGDRIGGGAPDLGGVDELENLDDDGDLAPTASTAKAAAADDDWE